MEKKSYESQILHTAYTKEDAYHSLSMPVYNTAAYEFATAAEMEAAFCGRTPEHTYSRISNPTVQYFEKRVQEVTGAMSVTALNSGMAAVSNALLNVAGVGLNIVTSPHLFGNTYSFMVNTLRGLGVEIRFTDLTKPEEAACQIDSKTCALFLEIITNPQMEVADLKALSAVCREAGVPLIADTTIIPFTAFSAKAHGVDIEVISSTKYISGGATGLGGLILDYGTFDWSRSPRLAEKAAITGKQMAFTARLKAEISRNLGAYMTPQAAYMETLGLETLDLRYRREAGTTLEVAQRLQEIPQVVSVNYTGLKDNPYYALSCAQFGVTPGAMFTMELASREACFDFLDRLQLIRRATNLFDNKSLALHPASTIFGTFTPEQRQLMHISQHTIRFSIGLESADDLIADITQALI